MGVCVSVCRAVAWRVGNLSAFIFLSPTGVSHKQARGILFSKRIDNFEILNSNGATKYVSETRIPGKSDETEQKLRNADTLRQTLLVQYTPLEVRTQLSEHELKTGFYNQLAIA